jgi:hypothetical protein
MLNFENLRKQAKQYLRWHRERYYPVAAPIWEHLPRFRQLTDQEILTADFFCRRAGTRCAQRGL